MGNDDSQQLDLLGIFHYILAGITAFFACFPLIHLFIGISLLSGQFMGEDLKGDVPPEPIAWLFIILALVFIMIGWAMAGVQFLTGRNLRRRQARTFCMIIGGIECLFFPFGTILGVFTIVVLGKESVIALFKQSENAGPI